MRRLFVFVFGLLLLGWGCGIFWFLRRRPEAAKPEEESGGGGGRGLQLLRSAARPAAAAAAAGARAASLPSVARVAGAAAVASGAPTPDPLSPSSPSSPPPPSSPEALFMVLNLDRRPDRWSCVRREFLREGLQVTRVAATDAKEVFRSREQRASFIGGLRILSDAQKRQFIESEDLGIFRGHLATFVTHVGAIRRIAELPPLRSLGDTASPTSAWLGRVGCIFEDDVFLAAGFSDRFAALMDAIQYEPNPWDLMLLNMYCTGNAFCSRNNGLRPASSKLLRPVRAFMSGAGYCLHRASARKILDTLPCTSGRDCTTAVDSYMSLMAVRGALTTYRAVDLPVAIPQDADKKTQPVAHADCFSRFDSDIALWWKPDEPRRGVLCVANVGDGPVRVTLREPHRPGADGKDSVLVAGASTIRTRTMEDRPVFVLAPGTPRGRRDHDAADAMDAMDAMRPRGGWPLMLRHVVKNERNTLFVSSELQFALVVTQDLWRGVSATVSNLGTAAAGLRIEWTTAGGTAQTVGPGETKEVFLPSLQQIVNILPAAPGRASPAGGKVTLRLSESCAGRRLTSMTPTSSDSTTEGTAGAAARAATAKACAGFQVLPQVDLRGRGVDLGGRKVGSAAACCTACRRHRRCTAWSYKSVLAPGATCWLKHAKAGNPIREAEDADCVSGKKS